MEEGDSECSQRRFFKFSRDSPVELFKGQTKRIQRGENIPDFVSSKARALGQGQKVAAGINPGVAKALAKRIRKPRYQWNIRSDREMTHMTRMTLEWIELVRNKENDKTFRLQNTKTFLQHFFVATSVFKHFNHRDHIKTLGSER